MKHSIKRKLQTLLDLCIEKNLTYNLSPHVFCVSVYISVCEFSSAYYYGRLYGFENGASNTISLEELIKKVKEL